MFRRFVFCIAVALIVFTARATTETLQWYVDGNLYTTTTCESGGDVLLPTAPTKTGYNFDGWLEYIPIEYLESTGTQYIDTGISPGDDIGMNFEIMWMEDTSSVSYEIPSAGSKYNSESQRYYTPGLYVGVFSYGWVDFYSSDIRYVIRKIYDIEFNYKNNRLIKIDSDIISLPDKHLEPFVSGSRILLFTAGYLNAKISHSRIYEAQITDGQNIVRDFIPVLDKNGTPCMYDKVTDQFFYNQGTGDFIAGPVIQ